MELLEFIGGVAVLYWIYKYILGSPKIGGGTEIKRLLTAILHSSIPFYIFLILIISGSIYNIARGYEVTWSIAGLLMILFFILVILFSKKIK